MKTKQITPVFEKTNLQYEVDYDYVRSQCTCDDYYCRCTTIERAWVESIEISKIVARLYSKYSREHSAINEYCFERICMAFKIYDKDYYEVESCYGYYLYEIYGTGNYGCCSCNNYR